MGTYIALNNTEEGSSSSHSKIRDSIIAVSTYAKITYELQIEYEKPFTFLLCLNAV